MYKKCQTERSAQRQRELENGFLQLMLQRKYEDITVSDLCAYLQIPRKSFYRYFSSKDGLLFALIDHTLGDFFQMPIKGKHSGSTAPGDLDLFFLFWYEHKLLLDALQYSSLSGLLVERATNFSLEENHLPQQLKHFSLGLRETAGAFTVCGLMSMLLQWHRQGFLISPEQMTKLAVELLTHPLLRL